MSDNDLLMFNQTDNRKFLQHSSLGQAVLKVATAVAKNKAAAKASTSQVSVGHGLGQRAE
jgi:hemoglobin-like flavoprotein